MGAHNRAERLRRRKGRPSKPEKAKKADYMDRSMSHAQRFDVYLNEEKVYDVTQARAGTQGIVVRIKTRGPNGLPLCDKDGKPILEVLHGVVEFREKEVRTHFVMSGWNGVPKLDLGKP